MKNPGIKTLFASAITVALSAQAQTAITDLQGALSVGLEFEFAWGSGGTSVGAVVQSSFDGGVTWRDIARADFATASAVKHCNLEFLLSKAMTSYAAQGSEGVYDGVMGDRLRAVITSVGTYVNTTLAIRANVR